MTNTLFYLNEFVGICPISCACHSLGGPLGSMPLNQYGFCENFCSKPEPSIDRAGFCGSSLEYRKQGSTDCLGCKGSLNRYFIELRISNDISSKHCISYNDLFFNSFL